MSESIINKNTSLDLFDMTEIKKTNYNEKKSEIKIERHDTSTPENPNLHKLTTENCKLHLQVKLLSQNLENIKDGKMIGLEKLDEFQNIQNIALKQENIQLSNTKIRLETINEQYKHEMEKLKAKVEEHKSKYIHSKNNFQCEVNKLSNTKLNQDKKIENLLEKLKSSELNCSKFDIKLKEVSQRLLLYESRLKHMSGMNPEQFDHPINSDSGFSDARPTRKKKRRSFNNMNKLLERENVTVTNFDTNALSINIDRETTIKDAIKDLKLTDMKYWRSDQVLTWLTFDVGLPIYSQMCAGNIRSGKVLYGISEQELYIALGVSNNLHKRKIKMVLNEYKSMKTIKFLHSRDISVQYVNQIWLEEIGLPQFSQSFLAAAIDGRMLNTLTRKDLERHLGINRKPHYISILCGIQFLKSMDYNLEAIERRRCESLEENEDLEVWSSQRIIKWLQSIDLSEYSNNLKETGIHGYVLMNDSSFVGESFATALGIPTSKAYIRRHVITELEQLIKKSKNSSLKRRGSNSNLGSSFVKTLRFSKQSSSKDLKEKRTSLSKSITRRFRSTSNSNKD